MVRTSLYYKTLDILTEAYHKKTLQYGCGARCAVANLIASNMGYTIPISTTQYSYWRGWYTRASWTKNNVEIKIGHWYALTHNSRNLWQKFKTIKYMGLRQYKLEKKHLAATGYTASELERIEMAFESCYEGHLKFFEQNILTGLDAVFAVLREIHQITIQDLVVNAWQDKVTAVIDRLVNRYQSVNFHFIHKTDIQSKKPFSRIY